MFLRFPCKLTYMYENVKDLLSFLLPLIKNV